MYIYTLIFTQIELIQSAHDDEYAGGDLTRGEQVLDFDEALDAEVVDGSDDT